jgi:hypothetical protein
VEGSGLTRSVKITEEEGEGVEQAVGKRGGCCTMISSRMGGEGLVYSGTCRAHLERPDRSLSQLFGGE